MTTVRVYVNYKPSVFDPQAEAILNSVHQLGHETVQALQAGKFFDLKIDQEQAAAVKIARQVAEALLVNGNIEAYRYEVLEAE